jgi:hypothetical protein
VPKKCENGTRQAAEMGGMELKWRGEVERLAMKIFPPRVRVQEHDKPMASKTTPVKTAE